MNEQTLDNAIQVARDAIRIAEMYASLCDKQASEIAHLKAVIAERDQTIEDMALGTSR